MNNTYKNKHVENCCWRFLGNLETCCLEIVKNSTKIQASGVGAGNTGDVAAYPSKFF